MLLDSAEVRRRCLGGDAVWREVNAQYGDLAMVDMVSAPPSAAAGEDLDVWLAWRILKPARATYQAFVHMQDVSATNEGTLWGNGTSVLYPSSEWEAGELLLSRLQVPTDATAVPGKYRLGLGFSQATRETAPLAARWHSGSADRAPIGDLELRAARARRSDQLAIPQGMQAFARPIQAGGLELLAISSLPDMAHPGERLNLKFMWRAAQDAPAAERLRLKLIQQDGVDVQEVVLSLLGGKFSPRLLEAGQVPTDEQGLLLGSQLPNGTFALMWELLDGDGNVLIPSRSQGALGKVRVEGRARSFSLRATPEVRQQASFDGKIELLGYQLQPASTRPGEVVKLRLHWRALSEMSIGYKVFTHVLDETQRQVLAQHDSEPLGGRAPTTGWLPGEFLEDDYRLAIPSDIPQGEYPVQIGFYDPRSGARLALPDGENRVILGTRLRVVAR